MSESGNRRESSARLKRNVTKMAFRGREKMLRSLGRGDETKDEIIDNYVHLVTKQQVQFTKFQQDMKRYLQSIIAMQSAANDFYASLGEVYEDGWMGKDMVASLSNTTNLLHSDLHARLNTEVISVMQDHITQCNEMKLKVNKRGRKLVDFDAARRNLAGLQGAKKLEESKLSRAQDHVTEAHDTYETLNSQLHEELPDLFDSRVVLCADIVTNIATAEKAFYNELTEVRTKLLHVVANIRDAFNNGEYRIQRLHSPMRVETASKVPEPATLPADESSGQRSRGHSERSSGDRRHSESTSNKNSRSGKSEERRKRTSNHSESDSHQYVNIQIGQQLGHVTNGSDQSQAVKNNHSPEGIKEQDNDKPKPSPRLTLASDKVATPAGASAGVPPATVAPQARPRTMTLPETGAEPQSSDKKKSQTLEKKKPEIPEEDPQLNGGSPIYDVPPETPYDVTAEIYEEVPPKDDGTVILPPHYLYTVQAMYPYHGADEDELSFEKNDVIYVVEFPDPEEQDEGWQMGILQVSWNDTGSTSSMGVFPENFTKPMPKS